MSYLQLMDGFFWFIAFAGYVWPLLPILILFYYLVKHKDAEIKWYEGIGLGIICFIAGFSHEQYEDTD